ncbi:hypothetical protein CLOSTASPAR_02969 [[Clostridium] asparagiforme DSM 15981]|uniref:Uncharacterized protein n=1 Tax=[Clostridium] asparagiforme DSM 15981 TaxID=518636 RepID=C0D132_9FIRM|nr:hypothetical protein CLOSTASPAR_02969 [[Clostridium] asparagiforme DSM 15981]
MKQAAKAVIIENSAARPVSKSGLFACRALIGKGHGRGNLPNDKGIWEEQ